jgi:hypothetical protein
LGHGPNGRPTGRGLARGRMLLDSPRAGGRFLSGL